MINRTDFAAWLRAMGHVEAGMTKNAYDCPLARFLRLACDYANPEVTSTKYYLTSASSGIDMPLWAQTFIDRVDYLGHGESIPVSAFDALTILNGIPQD